MRTAQKNTNTEQLDFKHAAEANRKEYEKQTDANDLAVMNASALNPSETMMKGT